MSGAFPIRFGRYELIERLAIGGMAELFRARVRGAEGFEKIVVIKRLLPHMAADAHFNEMFIDEAKLTARLGHPKIAQTYELGRHDDQLYIAMEFVDGIDGLALLRESAQRRETIAPAVAVHVMQATLDALDFAHNQVGTGGEVMGIVHRDVSPSNILLSRRGDIKLVDFGIARAAEQQSKTKSGTLKGKYGYMSPEQVLGEGLDARSDVFAAGIVLSEFLTGRRLFAAGNELDVLLMVRDARLERLDRFGANLDPALDAIVRKALHKERGQRFASAGDFREALDEWSYSNGERVSPRTIAKLVSTYYGTAQERRRAQLASAAEVAVSVPSDEQELELELAQSEAAVVAEIAGIPSGNFKVTDSVPIIFQDDEEDEIDDSQSAAGLADAAVGLRENSFELSLETAEPGAVGRALDELLANDMAEAKSGPWPALELVGDGPDTAAADADDDGVPIVVDDELEISVRYPSIEDAVASASARKPDPSALDFDDSEVAPELSERAKRQRLPTAQEIASAPIPKPPELALIGDTPARRGSLAAEPPISLLYQFMAKRSKGLVVVELSGIRKEIYLDDGVPVYVTSNLASELFGEYLVSLGVIAEGELSMTLAMMPHYGGKLGDTLVGLGLVRPLEVFRLLTGQVRQKLIDVCTWGKGDYFWYPGRENPRDAFPLDLEPYEVLGAGAMALPGAIVTLWTEAHADQRPKSRRNRVVKIGEFQLAAELRRHYDSLDGGKTLSELAARFTDLKERERFLRMLFLLFYTELVALQ